MFRIPSEDDGPVRSAAGKRGKQRLDLSDACGPIDGGPACFPVETAVFGRRRKVRAAWQPRAAREARATTGGDEAAPERRPRI
jgi:hypothetical protein